MDKSGRILQQKLKVIDAIDVRARRELARILAESDEVRLLVCLSKLVRDCEMNLCKSSANSNDIVSMKARSKIYSSWVLC
jgi:hypothetical protein